jgi:hypothetical protein
MSRGRGSALAAAMTLVALASPALGQEQAAPAESLFEEGRSLLTQGKYAEACAKFIESEKLDPAVGTLLNLGDCYEKQGKIATAWAVFKQATTMAHSGKQASREKIAAARVAALEGKVPRLSVSVPHPVPGLEVRRDGLITGQAEWSGAIPSAVTLDPGEHEIVAVAPGKKAWSTKVTLAADGQTTAVVVPDLVTDEMAERAPLKPVMASSSGVDVVNAHDRNVQRIVGAVIGGVGVISAIVSIPLIARANSLNNEAKGECPTNNTCTSRGQSDAQSAVTSGLVSTVLVLAGAGTAAAGVIIFFTAPSARPRGVGVRVAPHIAPGGGGLSVMGTF